MIYFSMIINRIFSFNNSIKKQFKDIYSIITKSMFLIKYSSFNYTFNSL